MNFVSLCVAPFIFLTLILVPLRVTAWHRLTATTYWKVGIEVVESRVTKRTGMEAISRLHRDEKKTPKKDQIDVRQTQEKDWTDTPKSIT